MAKVVGTPKIYSGTVRSPLGYGIEKALTANPMQQAAQTLKASQFSLPKVPRGKAQGSPRRNKTNPFYGE